MKNSTIKTLFSITIVLAFLLISNDVLARAGGGGGSGSGKGGIIGIIVWSVYTAIVTVILFFKTSKSNNIISRAFNNDQVWDINKMKSHSKSMFFKMQQAWMNRDLSTVKELITAELYSDYQQQLEIKKANKEKNILEDIHVSDVKIISCEDFHDNSKDSFVAYMKGCIIDYTISEETHRIIKNEERKSESFKDTYHFVRQGNSWVLNYIDNDVTIGDLIAAKNYREKLPRSLATCRYI